MVPVFGSDTRALPAQSVPLQGPKGADIGCLFNGRSVSIASRQGIDKGSRGIKGRVDADGIWLAVLPLPDTIWTEVGALTRQDRACAMHRQSALCGADLVEDGELR